MDPAVETPDLPHRLGLVVLGLAQLVANQFSKDPSNEPFIFRIYTSLRRRLTRFERVFARAQAELLAGARDGAAPPADPDGQPAATNPVEAAVAPALAEPPPADASPATVSPASAGAGASGGADQRPVRKPYHRLPRKRAWMLIMMPHQAALYWYRLDDLLRDPEMVAFLAISPKARRLLRPLWYGLCGDPLPACLREPPKPALERRALAAPDVTGAAQNGAHHRGGQHPGTPHPASLPRPSHEDAAQRTPAARRRSGNLRPPGPASRSSA